MALGEREARPLRGCFAPSFSIRIIRIEKLEFQRGTLWQDKPFTGGGRFLICHILYGRINFHYRSDSDL